MKEVKRGPNIKQPQRPYNEVELEIIRADMAYLIQKEKDSGDWAKWEESQKALIPIDTFQYRRPEPPAILDYVQSADGLIIHVVVTPIQTLPVTRELFFQCVGREPERDDMERCNCEMAGSFGHWSCGWCTDCNKPRYMCGHYERRRR